MKKHLLLNVLFLLAGTVCFASCDKDDDEPGNSGDNPNTGGIKVDNKGRDYVDLGLKSYWATCNIGATTPTDPGNKYAFGESKEKSEYTLSNYTGIYDNSDVAQQKWGGDWRLPSKEDLEELVHECTWEINRKNGIQVVTATGPNGNSIDLPYYSYIENDGLSGLYWSSTSYSSLNAYCLYFDSETVSRGTIDRYRGLLVRPVMTNYNYKGSGGGGGGNTGYEKPDIGFYDFTATKTSLKVQYKIYNKDEAKVSSAKIYYGTSSNPSLSKSATVSGVLITANITGLKAGTVYYVKCVATGKGGTTTSSVTKCITNY